MSKMISVSDELKEELDDKKDKSGHTSYDSLFRFTFEKCSRLEVENELQKRKIKELISEIGNLEERMRDMILGIEKEK